jgi:hypothetical protein
MPAGVAEPAAMALLTAPALIAAWVVPRFFVVVATEVSAAATLASCPRVTFGVTEPTAALATLSIFAALSSLVAVVPAAFLAPESIVVSTLADESARFISIATK